MEANCQDYLTKAELEWVAKNGCFVCYDCVALYRMLSPVQSLAENGI